MENKSNLADDIQQSEAEFRAQFDKNSENYHKGDPTPVPLGGQRIPESMQGQVYPENVDVTQYANTSSQPQEEYFGEEYKQVSQLRQEFLNLKKHIANLTKVLEAILRHKDTFQKKGDQNNEQHIAAFQKNMEAEVKKLKEQINLILPFVDAVEKTEFADRYGGFREMLNRAENDFKSKEDLGEYFLSLKKFNQNAFSDASKLMDRLKKIKKEYTAQSGTSVAASGASKPESQVQATVQAAQQSQGADSEEQKAE